MGAVQQSPFTFGWARGLTGRSNKFPLDFQGLSPQILGVEGWKGINSLLSSPTTTGWLHTSINRCIKQKFRPHCYKQISVTQEHLSWADSFSPTLSTTTAVRRMRKWRKAGCMGPGWQCSKFHMAAKRPFGRHRKKTSQSGTSTILRPFPRKSLLWLMGRGACCCQTSHCRDHPLEKPRKP